MPTKKIESVAVPTSAPNLAPIALDVVGTASFLSTSVPQVRSLVYRRELRPFKLGKKYLFRVEDLRSFVDRKASAA